MSLDRTLAESQIRALAAAVREGFDPVHPSAIEEAVSAMVALTAAGLTVKAVRRDADGGVVLDPFGGSGTTGVAALLEGRRAIVCELVPEYAEIARARMEAAESGRDWKKPLQASLFAAAESGRESPQ